MKLIKSPSGKIHARLKTGDPGKRYVKMTLGTSNAAEAKKKAKEMSLEKIERAMQTERGAQQIIARLTVGKKLTNEQAFAQWLERGPHRGESPSTTEAARVTGSQWFAAVPAARKLSPAATREEHISPFVNRPDAVTVATRERNLTVLRKFFTHCANLGVSQGNPAALVHVDVRKVPHELREKKKVQPFTEDELTLLLNDLSGADTASKNQPGTPADEWRPRKTPRRAADAAWWRWAVGISAATGLRLGDVCQLEHACLSTPGHIIVWTDKRDRRVCLPIDDTVTPGLAAALSAIPPEHERWLFPEQQALNADIKRRSKLSVDFGRILARIGIAGRTFHSLRHYAISRWRAQGFDLEQCRTYAGHAFSKTTEGYIHGA